VKERTANGMAELYSAEAKKEERHYFPDHLIPWAYISWAYSSERRLQLSPARSDPFSPWCQALPVWEAGRQCSGWGDTGALCKVSETNLLGSLKLFPDATH